jgi:spermidine/putrescine transport system permease protein
VGPSHWATGIGHVVILLPLAFAILYASMTEAQRPAERAARDLGAAEAAVLLLVTAPMLRPALLVAFLLCATRSRDEFAIAFPLKRFDVTPPVEIWSRLLSGLSPLTNAVAGVVVLATAVVVVAGETTPRRRR